MSGERELKIKRRRETEGGRENVYLFKRRIKRKGEWR